MLDTGYSIHREHVLKNNGVILDSLALLKAGKHCSPVISLEMLYEQFEKGHSMSELCDYMVSITDTELPLSVAGLTFLNHFEDFRDRITCRLVSQNKNEELLKTIPWIPCLDLAVIFSLVIESEGETQISSVITNVVSASWNLTPEDLFSLAAENTPRIYPASFRRLETVIEEYFPGSIDFVPEDCPGSDALCPYQQLRSPRSRLRTLSGQIKRPRGMRLGKIFSSFPPASTRS